MLFLAAPDDEQSGLEETRARSRESGRQEVDALDERQAAHVADHKLPIGPSQFRANRTRARAEQVGIETKRQFDGPVAQQRANALKAVVVRAHRVNVLHERRGVVRHRPRQHQERRAVMRRLVREADVPVDVDRLVALPAAVKRAFNPPLESAGCASVPFASRSRPGPVPPWLQRAGTREPSADNIAWPGLRDHQPERGIGSKQAEVPGDSALEGPRQRWPSHDDRASRMPRRGWW